MVLNMMAAQALAQAANSWAQVVVQAASSSVQELVGSNSALAPAVNN